jgi:hypothetical protein
MISTIILPTHVTSCRQMNIHAVPAQPFLPAAQYLRALSAGGGGPPT